MGITGLQLQDRAGTAPPQELDDDRFCQVLLSVCLSFSVSVCLSVFLSLPLSVSLSLSQSVYLCLSVCLSLSSA